MASVRIRVLLFARAREAYGKPEAALRFDQPATPAACFEQLCVEAPRLEALRPSLLVAVNERYAEWEQELLADDEVAFIPPVSGG